MQLDSLTSVLAGIPCPILIHGNGQAEWGNRSFISRYRIDPSAITPIKMRELMWCLGIPDPLAGVIASGAEIPETEVAPLGSPAGAALSLHQIRLPDSCDGRDRVMLVMAPDQGGLVLPYPSGAAATGAGTATSALGPRRRRTDADPRLIGALRDVFALGCATASVDLNDLAGTAVALAADELWRRVDVELHLEPGLPAVVCVPGETKLVLFELVLCAARILSGGGRNGAGGQRGLMCIATRLAGNFIEVVIDGGDLGRVETEARFGVLWDVLSGRFPGRLRVDECGNGGTAIVFAVPVGT
jgi:hypothetical protein